jgi:hypothetical protein
MFQSLKEMNGTNGAAIEIIEEL